MPDGLFLNSSALELGDEALEDLEKKVSQMVKVLQLLRMKHTDSETAP